MTANKNTPITVRCPKCSIVYDDINETKFKTSNLPILLWSAKAIIFECMNCKTHIPLLITPVYNVCSSGNEGRIIGKSIFNLF